LVIALSEPLRLTIASLGRPVLSAGSYVYCGSAHGPGGIAARVNRHLRRNKTARWHVDHLTNNGKIIDVTCLPNGEECDIVRNLSKIHNATTPIPGFGSSDCKQCISHLLSLPLNFAQ
tara:strand:+ start:337 stop:690 length:354 start_codon:yes stop_codon:yes gene_type:complete